MEKIKTALCSFGMSGRVFHAPFIHLHSGFELYAVLERTKNEAAAIYPGIQTYRSLEALLADDDIELVVVNTPNNSHYEFARLALIAGKHVIVEKPFTTTAEEAQALMRLASAQQRQLSVYQNRRWDSDFRTVKKLVDAHQLGQIVEAEIHFDRFSTALSSKLHKETPGAGTGVLYDLGSHLIDQALQLFGIPDSVFADIAIMRPAAQVNDFIELLLFYKNSRVRLRCSYLVREPLPAYILHGSKGSFIKTRADVQEEDLKNGKSPADPEWGLEPQKDQGLLHTELDGKVIREYIPSQKGNYMEYYNGIYEALRNNAAIPVPAEDGLLVMRVIDAAMRSAAEKKIIGL